MAITKENLRALYREYDKQAREEQSLAVRARVQASKATPDVFLSGKTVEGTRKNPKPVTMSIRRLGMSVQDLVAAYASMGIELEQRQTPSNPRRSAVSATQLTLSPQDLSKIAAHIKRRRQKFGVNTAKPQTSLRGIPYSQLLRTSRPIDKERAKEVRNAIFYGRQGDIFNFRVTGNVRPFYRVQIRLESWGMLSAAPSVHALKAAQDMVNGRLSIECPCGRHQFWYRYLATIGDYAIEPKETDFPKIRNPALHGCCCKHVLKVLQLLKTNRFIFLLKQEIEKERKPTGAKGSTRPKVFEEKFLRMAQEGRLSSKFYEQFKQGVAELKNLKARKPVAQKKQKAAGSGTSRTLNQYELDSIKTMLKNIEEFDLPRDATLNKVAKKLEITRGQLDAIIKEKKL